MDIAFYRYSFLNRGGDRVVVDYANSLADQGHLVTFHTCITRTVFTIHPSIHIHKLPAGNEINFLFYPLLHRMGHDFLIFDIIHCAPFLALRHRHNMIYFAQADDIEYYDNPLARGIIDQLYRRFFKKNLPAITVSESLTKAFRQRYQAGACYTVTNGINLQTFYPEPDPELLREKGDRKAIFFMARGDHYRKGFDIAVEVFKQLSITASNKLEIWICGDAPIGTSFSLPVRQFGVVGDGRLRQILSSADIFFYPSRHEGFGLFPLEAMACGCVPVVTDTIPYHAFSDCLQVAPVGDVATLQRLIVGLLDAPARFTALREQAKTAACRFDLRNSKELFCHTLEKLRLWCGRP